MHDSPDFTSVLLEATTGSPRAVERLFTVLYDELRARAALMLGRERPGHTLRPTDLVHEAYLHLADQTRCRWQNRVHAWSRDGTRLAAGGGDGILRL